MRAVRLRCDRLGNPLAVGRPDPVLSWVVRAGASDGTALDQAAFRVLCATDPGLLKEGMADLWDTGRVEGSDLRIRYAGRRLAAHTSVAWTVRVWDAAGRVAEWAAPSVFRVAPLASGDWKAEWIGVGRRARHPAPFFRKTFRLERPPRRAIVYGTALGLYELYVNGRRVGDYVLAPEWTCYRKRVHVQAHDVTALLKRGENVIGALVADGWYAGRIGLANIDPSTRGWGIYGDRLALRVQLHLESEGGTRIIPTDKSWKYTLEGPLVTADLLDGEVVDARRELGGWALPGYDDTGWSRSVPLGGVRTRTVGQPNEPLRVQAKIRPVQITEPARGMYVVNLGQNITGWIRLRLTAERGRVITIRHGERLKSDGHLYTENLRGARQTDVYIAAGRDEEVYEPRFTYHGFQYVEIHGLERRPRMGDITGMAVWSSAPPAGSFQCSNPMLNRLASNILWTQRDNMTGLPTDCPQRDERLGWCGDIQVFSRTGIYGMDMEAFLTKWLQDLRDDQADDGRFPDFAPHPFGPEARFSGAPGWGGEAAVLIPWRMYECYGSREALEDGFEPALNYVRWVRTNNPDHLWRNARGTGIDYGEWLNADTFTWDRYPKGRAELPKEVFATLMYYQSVTLLGRTAEVLDRAVERRELELLAQEIRRAFHAEYVDADGRIRGDTQAGYALALDLGILPPALEPRAFEHLLEGIRLFDGHLSTGFLATVPAMRELTRRGRADLAYRLLEDTAFPSWGYTVEHGGTTIWERWDGWTDERGFQNPSMNSFCHYAIGAVGEWMYSTILGIRPRLDAPGYRELEIRPFPGGSLSWARGHHDTVRGPVEVAWRIEEGRLALEVTVPPTATATVWVPAAVGAACETPEGVSELGVREECTLYRVGSGTYRFSSPWAATGSAEG